MNYSHPRQWDSHEDISEILNRIRTRDAKGVIIHDDGMDTRYSEFRPIDGIRFLVFDHEAERDRTVSIREIESILLSGDAYIVGGSGEERFVAAQRAAPRPRFENNPFGSKEAVISTAKRIAEGRQVPIDDNVVEALARLNELELVEAVMKYASDPGYDFVNDVEIAPQTLN